jgi:hypothetical protein
MSCPPDGVSTVLAKKRLPEGAAAEGAAGMAGLHELIGRHLSEDSDDPEVAAGIETDHGWLGRLKLGSGPYFVMITDPLSVDEEDAVADSLN